MSLYSQMLRKKYQDEGIDDSDTDSGSDTVTRKQAANKNKR
jgi:hypothetical protein